MNLLVTGGAGFIGSNFVRYFLKKYSDVHITVLDNLSYAGNLSSISELYKVGDFRFYPGLIQDKTLVQKIIELEEIDVILNFAAETHNDRSMIDNSDFIQTNVFGVYVLLELCREYSIKRFVHVSTDEVYGSIDQGEFTEESPLSPNTPYSASKAGGDLQVRAHYKVFGTPVMITRGANTYGPNQYPEKLIPFFVTRLIEGKKIPLYGEGLEEREWLYVMDHVEAIDTVLHHGKPGEIYNIPGNAQKKNLEVVELLLESTGRDSSYVKQIKDLRGDAHDARYAMRGCKLRDLGWHPTSPFKPYLHQTVSWYKENKHWWRPIVESENYTHFLKQFYGPYLKEDL